MDNQRSLFKKFFKAPDNHPSSPSTGFNPPKFQFNKKKLSAAFYNQKENKEENENAACHEDDTDMHMWDENSIIASTSDHASESKISSNNIQQQQHQLPPQASQSSLIYSDFKCKNQMKFSLNSQLTSFTGELEFLLQMCSERRNAMELVILGIDEKIAEVNTFKMNYYL